MLLYIHNLVKKMANITQNTFSFPFKDIIVDEIALDGLEGTGIGLLWKRIEKRISSSVTEKMQSRLWNIILNSNSIYLYENPEPVPCIEVLDRFSIIDEISGDLKEPDDYLDGPYEFNPIENENGCEGSCVHYQTRILLNKQTLSQMSYKDILSKYNATLVLVTTKEERWAALAPHLPITYAAQLSKLHYCILELIGRARENGQMTVGKSNLGKVVKDSKLLFYNRKILQQLELVKISHVTQVTTNKGGTKAILLRLKRFHKSTILSVPRTGWISKLIDYLKEQPNYCASTETVLKNGLLTQKQNKRFQKKFYIFGFEEKPININEMAAGKKRERINKKRRYIYLSSNTDDESSESDDEEQKPQLQCLYKVGVQILRQAYERFLEAGLKGLTQIELGQLLGIEFYLSRTICRLFKFKNIVREFLEDKGRQRTARYIAVAATAKMDTEYAEEKEKFLKYVDECVNLTTEENLTNHSSDSDDTVPRKKIKTEKENEEGGENGDYVFEIKNIQGTNPRNSPNPLSDSSKKQSLRQLRCATGALKIIKERQIVVGFQELGKLIAAEIKEPPMDTKALKNFLQRMINDGCAKLIGIKWPGYVDKYSTLICAPHIKPSHPYVKAKYKSIVKNTTRKLEKARRKLMPARPLTQYSFPRYMKLQKLHEAIVKYAYLDEVKPNDLPRGFFHIKDLIPELTLETALGTISSAGVLNISKYNIDDALLLTKVRDVPEDLRRALTSTTHLDASIRLNLKILASFGLVQLIAQVSPASVHIPDNCLAIYLFYVNKNAAILDTSGVWPKKNVCKQNLEKKFNFKTFDDVKDFWCTVYNISTNTTVEIPNRKQSKPPKVPIRTMNEVDQHDIGLRFGNKLGPCGFDSIYYLDIARLWITYSLRSNSNNIAKQIQIKRTMVKIPKSEKPKRRVQKTRKKAALKSKRAQKLPQIQKSLIKQALLRQPVVTHRKKIVDTVKWTLEDDKMIMLCRVAMTIMSPISQAGCLQIRNLVTKDILAIRDPKKTPKLCHWRAAIVDSNSTMIHLKDCIMTELKYHNSILQKYEGLLKKLRILNANNSNSKYINVAKLPMIELVWALMKVLNICSARQTAPVFTNIEDLLKEYKVVPTSANRPRNTYKTEPNDIVQGPLKESIMLTVMLSFQNTVSKEMAKKLYQHFKRYDERTLRKAVMDLRQCGAMSAKEKILNSLLHKINLDDIVDCWFKISAQYQRKWQVRLNAEFADEIGDFFQKPLRHDGLKGSSEYNCFCCELQVTGVLDVIIAISPVISGFTGSIVQEDQLNAIDIESKYKLKSGTYSWQVKSGINKISDIYESIDIEEPLQQIIRQSVIREDQDHGSTVENELTDIESKIVAYLKMKAEHGSTFLALKEFSGIETEALMKILTKLINENVLKRVGIYDNIFVTIESAKNWCIEVNSYHILSKPWLTVSGEMRKDIFLKWAGVVLNKIFESPGGSLSYLSDCCEFLTTAAVQDVCDVLCKWGCVTLRTMIQKEPDFFSEDDDVLQDLVDYNMYEAPQNIVVFPVADCLVRYSFIRKTILNSL